MANKVGEAHRVNYQLINFGGVTFGSGATIIVVLPRDTKECFAIFFLKKIIKTIIILINLRYFINFDSIPVRKSYVVTILENMNEHSIPTHCIHSNSHSSS